MENNFDNIKNIAAHSNPITTMERFIENKNIEVITDYAIENQRLKEENNGLLRVNGQQAMKIKSYRDTIKQTIQHLENQNSEEESTEEFHYGLVSWLNGVLEGKW